jgi:hypothetical protein
MSQFFKSTADRAKAVGARVGSGYTATTVQASQVRQRAAVGARQRVRGAAEHSLDWALNRSAARLRDGLVDEDAPAPVRKLAQLVFDSIWPEVAAELKDNLMTAVNQTIDGYVQPWTDARAVSGLAAVRAWFLYSFQPFDKSQVHQLKNPSYYLLLAWASTSYYGAQGLFWLTSASPTLRAARASSCCVAKPLVAISAHVRRSCARVCLCTPCSYPLTVLPCASPCIRIALLLDVARRGAARRGVARRRAARRSVPADGQAGRVHAGQLHPLVQGAAVRHPRLRRHHHDRVHLPPLPDLQGPARVREGRAGGARARPASTAQRRASRGALRVRARPRVRSFAPRRARALSARVAGPGGAPLPSCLSWHRTFSTRRARSGSSP